MYCIYLYIKLIHVSSKSLRQKLCEYVQFWGPIPEPPVFAKFIIPDDMSSALEDEWYHYHNWSSNQGPTVNLLNPYL